MAGRTQPPVLQWHLEPSAAAVGRMRHELGAALDLRGVADDAHEAVLLVAYELAANAVEHVGSPVHVVATFSAGSVRIAVTDGSPDSPRLRPPNSVALRGRGLQMVDGLANRWSWSRDGDGKTVWADLPTDRSLDGP
jgi:anti-sigma regulatory factor (Ser/Thr protein kinase)